MRVIPAIDFHAIDWTYFVEAIEAGHRLSRAQLDDSFLGPSEATLLSRAAYIPELGYLVKSATVLSDNAQRGLPTVQTIAAYFDSQTGTPMALLDGASLTNIKTAADSVCGARALANPEPKVLFSIGAGTVARHSIAAYLAMFPSIRSVRVFSRSQATAMGCLACLESADVDFERVQSIEDGCRGADVICSSTMATEPVLHGQWVDPGTHVDLVGAFKANMREADDELMARASVFVDSRDTTIAHIGELIAPIQSGALKPEDIQADLYELVGQQYSRSPSEVTVFKNGGGAHLDLMVAKAMIDQAVRA